VIHGKAISPDAFVQFGRDDVARARIERHVRVTFSLDDERVRRAATSNDARMPALQRFSTATNRETLGAQGSARSTTLSTLQIAEFSNRSGTGAATDNGIEAARSPDRISRRNS